MVRHFEIHTKSLKDGKFKVPINYFNYTQVNVELSVDSMIFQGLNRD